MQVVLSNSPYGSAHILPQLAKAAPGMPLGVSALNNTGRP